MNIHCTATRADTTTAPAPLPKVRLAVEADIPQLMEFGRMLHSENAMMPHSEERTEAAIRRAVRQERAIMGVIGSVGHIQGAIYLTTGMFWYSSQPHLEELFSWVHPDYRKSDNAKALVEFAKTSALRLKVPLLIGIISNTRTKAKVRLYERRLGEPSGAFFLYNGHTGNH
jgi:N-acetylglutamate synthase-like GNAT family acetyltransferase